MVKREQRCGGIHHNRRNQHTAKRTQEKGFSQKTAAEKSDRDIEYDGHRADGKGEQAVQDNGNSGKPGHRKSGRKRKIINADGNQEAAEDFHAKNPEIHFWKKTHGD